MLPRMFNENKNILPHHSVNLPLMDIVQFQFLNVCSVFLGF